MQQRMSVAVLKQILKAALIIFLNLNNALLLSYVSRGY